MVECKCREGEGFLWRPGHITVKEDWAEGGVSYFPYQVYFDNEEDWSHHFAPPGFVWPLVLRFKVGDRIEIPVDEDDKWSAGTVVQLSVEKEGYIYPYSVRLDSGDYSFLPSDSERRIRRSDTAPIVVKFATGSRVECKIKSKGNEW